MDKTEHHSILLQLWQFTFLLNACKMAHQCFTVQLHKIILKCKYKYTDSTRYIIYMENRMGKIAYIEYVHTVYIPVYIYNIHALYTNIFVALIIRHEPNHLFLLSKCCYTEMLLITANQSQYILHLESKNKWLGSCLIISATAMFVIVDHLLFSISAGSHQCDF